MCNMFKVSNKDARTMTINWRCFGVFIIVKSERTPCLVKVFLSLTLKINWRRLDAKYDSPSWWPFAWERLTEHKTSPIQFVVHNYEKKTWLSLNSCCAISEYFSTFITFKMYALVCANSKRRCVSFYSFWG